MQTVILAYGRETFAVAQRILTELVRRKRSLIFWAMFPITLLVINSLILEERAQLSRGAAYASATAPTLVGAALFFSCLGGSIATVVSEREQRTLKRLFVSPLRGISYFLGICLAHCCIALGQTLLVFTIALALGADFQGNVPLTIAILFLSVMSYVGVGFMLGTQLARRTEDANALVAAFGVPLLLLGGAFLPTSLFPDSLLAIAAYNPVYHMNEALMAVLIDEAGVTDISNHLTFLVLFTTVVVAGGWFFYQQMLRIERTF
nr:ABC transporter permease [Prochlorothrix hollandica]